MFLSDRRGETETSPGIERKSAACGRLFHRHQQGIMGERLVEVLATIGAAGVIGRVVMIERERAADKLFIQKGQDKPSFARFDRVEHGAPTFLAARDATRDLGVKIAVGLKILEVCAVLIHEPRREIFTTPAHLLAMSLAHVRDNIVQPCGNIHDGGEKGLGLEFRGNQRRRKQFEIASRRRSLISRRR